jgi:hypothetical protein
MLKFTTLIIEKLCGLRPSGNTPVVEIEQAQEKRQLPLPIQDLDLHEIRELPDECLHALIEAPTVVFDMRAQQRLHAVVGELRLQFSNRARGVPKQASERRAHSGFRPSAFEQNAIEDFHLIKTVALRLKELSPLLDDLIEAQHHSTSTRGTACFAASYCGECGQRDSVSRGSWTSSRYKE